MFHYPSPKRPSRLSLLLSLFVLVLATNAFGSSNAPAEVEVWRPISPSDLALKAPLVEPEADAEAIFWDIRVDDGGDNDLVLSNYIRIKIFTERGREKSSKVEIPFFNNTKIKDVAARVIKADGSIVELGKDEVLEKTVVQVSGLKLRTKSFVFPGLEPGAIIEYKWREVISRAGANNMRLQFQRSIPVQSITYHIKPSDSTSRFAVYPFNMPQPRMLPEKDGFEYITVTNMKAFHEEPFMPPEESVRSWALLKYQTSFVSPSYEAMARQLYFDWQQFLKVDDDVKRKAAEIVAGASTPEEKLQKIFDFVRANIKNTDDKNSGFTSEQIEKLKENKKPADTLKRGVGTAGDVNLLFAALANAADLQARIALLPDRSKRFFSRSLQIPGALPWSIIAVRVGENWKFFNPGGRFAAAGMSFWHIEGVDALIVDQSPKWVMTPISPPEKSKETRVATLSLDENGTLEGDVTVEYTGHLGVGRKEMNDDDSPNQREENLKAAVKARLSSAELSNIVIENVSDPVKPFTYKYHVKIPEYAQRTGRRLFLQPAFFEKGIATVFASSQRRHDIYFSFPWSEEDKVTIALPKGYTPDNPDVPAPITAGDVCSYAVKMGMNKDQSVIVYSRSFRFGNDKILLFPPEGYGDIKRLFDTINKSDNHTIAIKQSTAVN
jgi:hypothetical protein